LARNKTIFQDSRSSPAIVAAHGVAIMSHFSHQIKTRQARIVRVEDIDFGRPWGYFDGSSQATGCGGGGVLYLEETHSFKFVAGLGGGTNNYAELMALKLLLLLAVEKGCRTLQVFGDSMLVIGWAQAMIRCGVMRLIPILEEVHMLTLYFDSICFNHVYRERNHLADNLSKEATLRPFGQWFIIEHGAEGEYRYYHRPFHEPQQQIF